MTSYPPTLHLPFIYPPKGRDGMATLYPYYPYRG